MNHSNFWSILTALLLLAWYLLIGLNGQRLGFHAQEALFLTEKALIVWQGTGGDKLSVIGLTFPVFPFFFSLLFGWAFPLAGPVVASAVGMSVLFWLVISDQARRQMPRLIRLGTVLLFFLHPGLIYAAASGRSIYAILLFGYLFFYNLLAYYRSNTTYHVSLASLYLVCLVFSASEFAWLTLFLLPLVLFMSLHSLQLRGEDTLQRLGLAFNNLSLRRKLVNKSFALMVLMFVLPLVGLFLFSLLNQVYADDPYYFLDSPYANWRVLNNQMQHINFSNHPDDFLLPDASLLNSLKRLLYAPLLGLVLFWFRGKAYQLLTLLSPFALIEFLYIKNPADPFPAGYYLLFVVMAWSAMSTLSGGHLKQLRIAAFGLMLLEPVMGGLHLATSAYEEERAFIQSVLLQDPMREPEQRETDQLARLIRQLPEGSRVLADDATAYSVIALTQGINWFVLPYQYNYLPALTSDGTLVDYVLVHTESRNPLARFSVVNEAYLADLKTRSGRSLVLHKQLADWQLYRFQAPGASAGQPSDAVDRQNKIRLASGVN